ncbi:MAG: hypothetical protein EA428_11275 [Spirochaetaceae bacterium]|nr:MAG: hypothetical protein EA428_11275 [Spirochaetaceae bacterium]
MAVSLPALFSLHKLSREQAIVRAIMVGALGVLVFTIASGIHSGLLGPGVGSVEGGVLALSADGREIAVVSPFDGELLGTIELEYEAAQIMPTPGGVSVFVSFRDREELRVYSTTEFELQEIITFDGRVPEYLLFSENGDTLFVSYVDVPVISVFNHSMRSLDLSFEFEVDGSYGPLHRNRRATRLYRATPTGLATIFAANGEVIETLSVSAAALGFNPGYTHIWALESDLGPAVGMSVRSESRAGVPVLVEERTGSMRRVEAEVAAGPVFATERGEASGPDYAAFLSASGSRVLLFDSRTGEQEGELELPFAAVKLQDSGVGSMWAVALDGSLAVINPGRGTVRQASPDRSRAARPADSPAGDAPLAADANRGAPPAATAAREPLAGARVLVPSVVQTGGNFACF